MDGPLLSVRFDAEEREEVYQCRSVCFLVDLGERFSLSVSAVSKLFKRVCGINFYDFLLSGRMELACEMLKNNKLSLGAVARAVGYENEYSPAKDSISRANSHVAPESPVLGVEGAGTLLSAGVELPDGSVVSSGRTVSVGVTVSVGTVVSVGAVVSSGGRTSGSKLVR